jgi:uncharacterized repeat protein (TIGR03803 family)
LLFTEGAYPVSGLIEGKDGNFYGTAFEGANGYGSVFRMTPEGKLTVLHSFGGTDGAYPWAGLTVGNDGNLYGATSGGGTDGQGTAFKITVRGTLTTLHSFDVTGGDGPFAPLLQDTNGSFYSTTVGGGASGHGTVFGLSLGLGPFVKTNPISGKSGATVRILGDSLTGATSATFNGTAANFTVVSGTCIKTTVPTGATTGPVQVVTPSGTLTSNVNFRVLP